MFCVTRHDRRAGHRPAVHRADFVRRARRPRLRTGDTGTAPSRRDGSLLDRVAMRGRLTVQADGVTLTTFIGARAVIRDDTTVRVALRDVTLTASAATATARCPWQADAVAAGASSCARRCRRPPPRTRPHDAADAHRRSLRPARLSRRRGGARQTAGAVDPHGPQRRRQRRAACGPDTNTATLGRMTFSVD